MKNNYKKIELKLTNKELDYLKELLGAEMFKIKGVAKVSKDPELKNELSLLESLGGKFLNISL